MYFSNYIFLNSYYLGIVYHLRVGTLLKLNNYHLRISTADKIERVLYRKLHEKMYKYINTYKSIKLTDITVNQTFYALLNIYKLLFK